MPSREPGLVSCTFTPSWITINKPKPLLLLVRTWYFSLNVTNTYTKYREAKFFPVLYYACHWNFFTNFFVCLLFGDLHFFWKSVLGTSILRLMGEGNGNPLQYSCLEIPMDRGAWWATVHGVAKSWTWLRD